MGLRDENRWYDRYGPRTDWQEDYLNALNVAGPDAACVIAKVSPVTVWRERKRSPSFNDAYFLGITILQAQMERKQVLKANLLNDDRAQRWYIERVDRMKEAEYARMEAEEHQQTTQRYNAHIEEASNARRNDPRPAKERDGTE